MKGATVCSGIGAPEVAMPNVEWLFAAEIDHAARAVYAHRHPETELFSDFTVMRHDPRIIDVELLVGGTPCQSFSIAGLRQSLADDRGNLSLEFIRLANAIDDLRCADGRDDAFILWENVPGVLSVSDNAFGTFLGGLVGSDTAISPNGRWANAGVVAGPRRIAAWRILDAQHFGVPQRRRRLFVLANGHSRGWACADALLSIAHGLSNASPPTSPTRENLGGTITSRPKSGGWSTDVDMAAANWMQVAPCGRAYMTRPVEWERAFGFPDDFTLVPYRNRMMADGPRYKMLGNSMAVPVVSWIGQRIAMVDATRPSPAPPLAAISEPVGGGDFGDLR